MWEQNGGCHRNCHEAFGLTGRQGADAPGRRGRAGSTGPRLLGARIAHPHGTAPQRHTPRGRKGWVRPPCPLCAYSTEVTGGGGVHRRHAECRSHGGVRPGPSSAGARTPHPCGGHTQDGGPGRGRQCPALACWGPDPGPVTRAFGSCPGGAARASAAAWGAGGAHVTGHTRHGTCQEAVARGEERQEKQKWELPGGSRGDAAGLGDEDRALGAGAALPAPVARGGGSPPRRTRCHLGRATALTVSGLNSKS